MSPLPVPEIDPKVIRKTREYKKHQKTTFWQIYFPLILSIALVLMVTVFAVLTTIQGDMAGTNSKWSSLILIIFISVISIFALGIAAALFYMAYTLAKGIHAAPVYTNMAKYYTNLFRQKVGQWSDAIVSPVIKAGGTAKGIHVFLQSITHTRKK
ncbi:MAG: hypothetical protein HPY85_01870 [Anaerolineae bacterium]|nr:hypothetical protein [Anaerolineae bacterium]